jgi:hypothetical protein
MKISAPFTSEQAECLNRYQRSGEMHPFTCGGNRSDKDHLDHEGILVAVESGWICPFCDYTQDWAHDFMVSQHARRTIDERIDAAWKNEVARLRAGLETIRTSVVGTDLYYLVNRILTEKPS